MDLLRILALWRTRTLWLAAGLVIALAALATGVAQMAVSGAMIGTAVAAGALVAPVALRGLGGARVVLCYLERLVTHAATFRALADLRVWFFRHLARTAAGGLGFRHAGDVLARLVGDVEALDGLYLRILVPLAGALLLLPVRLLAIGRDVAGLAAAIGVLFATGVLDALTGLREVRVFGAEGRMIATVQAHEAALLSAQHDLARRISVACAVAFLCGKAAIGRMCRAGCESGREMVLPAGRQDEDCVSREATSYRYWVQPSH